MALIKRSVSATFAPLAVILATMAVSFAALLMLDAPVLAQANSGFGPEPTFSAT